MRAGLIAVSAVLGLLSSAAMAADLPNTKGAPAFVAPTPAPAFSWSGCYVGANVGGAWAHQSANTLNPTINAAEFQAPDFVTLNGAHVIGGGQIGCNYEFNSVVAGFEGDFSGTHLSSTAIGPNNFPGGAPVGTGSITFSRTVDWLASIRGRLGYAVVPNVLLYATGGGAWARASYFGFDVFSTCPNCGTASFGATRFGWVAGGGVEWEVWNNVILRAEYLHYSFAGASSIAPIDAPFVGSAAQFNFGRLNVDEARVA
jgi:outer membrane immunogenic protein